MPDIVFVNSPFATRQGDIPQYTTSQRDALVGVPEGLLIYNLTTHKYNFWNGSGWEVVTSA